MGKPQNTEAVCLRPVDRVTALFSCYNLFLPYILRFLKIYYSSKGIHSCSKIFQQMNDSWKLNTSDITILHAEHFKVNFKMTKGRVMYV